jgi:cell division protein FtsI (penicillin-binding protein 3)
VVEALSVDEDARKRRLLIVVVLIIAASAIFAVRLAYIQILQSDHYRAMASDEHFRRTIVAPRRGNILDTTDHLFATTVNYRTLFATTSEVGDPRATADRLAPLVHLSSGELAALLSTKQAAPVIVKRWLPDDEADAVQALGKSGLFLQPEPKRMYPQGAMLDQVLGVVGTDNNGLGGLELRYDSDLAGKPGSLVAERDSSGDAIALGPQLYEPPSDGASIVLTVDRYVQWVAERELAAAIGRRHAVSGIVVVLDPRSGAILAMAARPTFLHDDADPYAVQNVAMYGIPAVAAGFEPRATYQLVTMAAALETGAVTPGASFFDSGSFDYAGRVVLDAFARPPGPMAVNQVLLLSSNVGLSWAAARTGAPKYYRIVDDFGFGDQTGVDLPGEVGGMLRQPTAPDWSIFDLAQNASGQGIEATPLQVALAAATVANGGVRMRPFIVERVVDTGGSRRVLPTVDRRVIRTETASALIQMLTTVVEDESATYSRAARVDGYSIAGIGGNSPNPRVAANENGRESDAFVGFGPANRASFVIYARLDGGGARSTDDTTAAALFGAIARQLMSYYQIPPIPALAGNGT